MKLGIKLTFTAFLIASCASSERASHVKGGNHPVNTPVDLWSCEGADGNAKVTAIIQKKIDNSVSGTITLSTPRNNGAVRTLSWSHENVASEPCAGFTMCDGFFIAGANPQTRSLDMLVNYNNSTSTTGSGYLNYTDSALINHVEVAITCTRTL